MVQVVILSRRPPSCSRYDVHARPSEAQLTETGWWCPLRLWNDRVPQDAIPNAGCFEEH